MTAYVYTIVNSSGRSRSSLWGEKHGAKPDAYSRARASDEYEPDWAWPTGLAASAGTTYTDSQYNADAPVGLGGGFHWRHVRSNEQFTQPGAAIIAPTAGYYYLPGTHEYPPGSGVIQTDPRVSGDTPGAVLVLGTSGSVGAAGGELIRVLQTSYRVHIPQPVVLLGTLQGPYRRGGWGLLCSAVRVLWSSSLHPTTLTPVGVPGLFETLAAVRTWLAANP